MRKAIFYLCAIIAGGFIINFMTSKFISKDGLVGTYIYETVNQDAFIADLPNSSDTLILSEDNSFSSKYWGNGTYHLTTEVTGSNLTLYYGGRYDKGSYEFTIKNNILFSSKKIIINEDLDMFYEKIQSDITLD